MLHVAIGVLMAGAVQQMGPDTLRLGEGEGGHVLELVAEANGSAGLVEAAAGFQPGGSHLPGQQTVHEQVQTVIGGGNLQFAKANSPFLPGLPIDDGGAAFP